MATTVLLTFAAFALQLVIGLLGLACVFQLGFHQPRRASSQLVFLSLVTAIHVSITTVVTVLAVQRGVQLIGGIEPRGYFYVLHVAQFVLVSPGATIYRYSFPWCSGLGWSPLQFQGALVLLNSLFYSALLLVSWSVLGRWSARRSMATREAA